MGLEKEWVRSGQESEAVSWLLWEGCMLALGTLVLREQCLKNGCPIWYQNGGWYLDTWAGEMTLHFSRVCNLALRSSVICRKQLSIALFEHCYFQLYWIFGVNLLYRKSQKMTDINVLIDYTIGASKQKLLLSHTLELHLCTHIQV